MSERHGHLVLSRVKAKSPCGRLHCWPSVFPLSFYHHYFPKIAKPAWHWKFAGAGRKHQLREGFSWPRLALLAPPVIEWSYCSWDLEKLA